MRRLHIIILIAIFVSSTIVDSYCYSSSYYIEIKESTAEIGMYGIFNDRKEIAELPLSDLKSEEIVVALKLNLDDKILLYFHSLWGGFDIYHYDSLKKLDKIEGVDKIISVLWHSTGFGYNEMWTNSILEGKKIAPLIEKLSLATASKVNILCHSMGNRVFEGIVKSLKTDEQLFHHVFLMAPDLDVDVLDYGLSKLPVNSEDIFLYFNKDDRLLLMSKISHGRDRLGLDALEYLPELDKIPNLQIIDVTSSVSKGISLSNHLYFKRYKSALKDVGNVISDNQNSREVIEVGDKLPYTKLK